MRHPTTQLQRRIVLGCAAALWFAATPTGLAAETPTPSGEAVASQQLDSLAAQREAEEARAADLAVQLEELMSALPATGSTSGPISLAEFERLEGEIESTRNEVAQAEAGLVLAREALAAAAGTKAGTTQAGDLRHRIIEERVALRRAALESARGLKLLAEQRSRNAELAFAAGGARLEITASDFDRATHDFDAREAGLKRSIERAELALREAEARWNAVRGQSGDVAAREALAGARADLALRQKTVALQGAELARLEGIRFAVGRRLRALSSPPLERAVATAWLGEVRTTLPELRRELRLDQADSGALEQELAGLKSQADEPSSGKRIRALEARLELLAHNQSDLREAIAAEERLVGTLERMTGSTTLADRIVELLRLSRRVWNYELGVAGDQVVTVGKVLLAILLMIFGLLGARLSARTLERRVLPRFGLDEGASHAFGELAFYALLVVVFLVSLQSVSIPITAFAVVGGALAIGVGFGSQNVVNNFISGIILLAERPIKIGDLVQVDETYGNVERIGLRSTRIRTGENIHVIMPNSTFLETKVINWTHNDANVRVSVSVGVAYESPIHEVQTRIRSAIDAVPGVMQTPEPVVLFTDFGDNALGFEAHFWSRIPTQMDRRKLESAVRFEIHDQFREASITIAFPQRDVHLDTLSPIEVRFMDRPPNGEEAK